MSRTQALGQALPDFTYDLSEEEVTWSEMKLIGHASNTLAIMTYDPTPLASGLFSSESMIQYAPLGSCRMP